MVTDLAAVIEGTELKTSNTGIENLIQEIGLTYWSLPSNDSGDDEIAVNSGIDEEFIYSMGYTVGGLPVSHIGGANDYCSRLAAQILYTDGKTSCNDLQNRATIYLSGYQSGLRAR